MHKYTSIHVIESRRVQMEGRNGGRTRSCEWMRVGLHSWEAGSRLRLVPALPTRPLSAQQIICSSVSAIWIMWDVRDGKHLRHLRELGTFLRYINFIKQKEIKPIQGD